MVVQIVSNWFFLTPFIWGTENIFVIIIGCFQLLLFFNVFNYYFIYSTYKVNFITLFKNFNLLSLFCIKVRDFDKAHADAFSPS